jgi:geranylgeranyl pyrophosphate synthase
LREASHYNFKLKGKNFRSCIIMLLSRALFSRRGTMEEFYETEEYEISCLLSACVEIAHNSSLLQDDIIDKAENRRNSPAAYKVYGKSNSVFASNFLIARASGILS